ncbi:MAG: tol-pal system protein YbgF [Trichlorobacter sp.]|uniref:tol-pal system protein YbgF n=1 Tax=Trichlorobacter sp. TaxID=2911007 RepID=UPI0025622E04|nr:tol-pal system protein YbgF [Trichlorobacter sp.]MDK9718827.1 tol-pal system protein YbgF [Trichlorobacter sp.]
MIKVWSPVFCLLAALASGCASSGSVEAVRRDIDETKSRIYTIEKDLSAAREGEKTFKSDFATLRKGDADLQANIDSLKSDMQIMAGKLDDQRIAAKKPAEELTRYREDSDRRIVALEDRIVKLQVALDELNKRMKEVAQGSSTAGKDSASDALYLKGLEAFKAGDMPSARTQLTSFIEKNSSHDLVPNARYWIGETYYGEKNYEQAILEFQEVVKQYPKKEKAPAAMLKQALSFKALKDLKSTQYLLKRLIADYPKSDEAKKAKVLLKEVK